jgi:phosphoglycolate phosphatase
VARAHDLVLFDLDGTLSDPLEGFSRSVNYALTGFGRPQLTPADLAIFLGPPIEETFERITGNGTDAEVKALVAKYRERYADVGYSENVLYPGVRQALQGLGEASVPMAVCTTKPKEFAEKILGMFGLMQYFRFIDGGGSGVQKWQQMEVLRARGRVSEASIMVGDRAMDMIAAHRNGLRAAGVLWGYGSRTELANETPLCLFASPDELSQLARI